MKYQRLRFFSYRQQTLKDHTGLLSNVSSASLFAIHLSERLDKGLRMLLVLLLVLALLFLLTLLTLPFLGLVGLFFLSDVKQIFLNHQEGVSPAVSLPSPSSPAPVLPASSSFC